MGFRNLKILGLLLLIPIFISATGLLQITQI